VKGGKFVFEKDSEYLEVGDAFDFTITDTKDDREGLGFEVSNAEQVEDCNEGVYNIHMPSVKKGECVFRKIIDGTSGSFEAGNFDEDPPVQAVSNVLLCAKVWWQVDFGRGEPPQPPRYGNGDRNTDPILAATGNGTESSIVKPITNWDERGSDWAYVNVIDDNEKFDIDIDEGTATIEFEDNEAEQLHLASFETSGEYKRCEIDYQDLFDVEYWTEEDDGELEVDIPTVDDYA